MTKLDYNICNWLCSNEMVSNFYYILLVVCYQIGLHAEAIIF